MAFTFEQPNISTAHVTVAAPRVFVNNYSASQTPATILFLDDATAGKKPPYLIDDATNFANMVTAGWFDLGAIDAVTMPVTKDFVKYEAGATRTIRKQYEKSRSAQLTFSYREMMPYVKAYCTGSTIYNKTTGSATTTTGTPTRTTVAVTSATGLAVGDTIGIALTSGAIPTSYNLGVITNIATLTLTVVGLQSAPAAGDSVQKVIRTEYNDPIGTITERTVLMFFDYETSAGKINQYAVWFPKVITASAYAPDFKDANDYMTASVTFDAMSTTQTLDDASSKLVLYRAWDIGQK